MKTLKLLVIVLLAVLGLSLVAAQEDELQPGMAMVSFAIQVRAEASGRSDAVGRFSGGEIVTVLVVEGNWAQIEFEQTVGWVQKSAIFNLTQDDLLPAGEHLPAPSGPFQVGATFRQWVDESREHIFTEDPDDHRILSAWIYYPAEVEGDAERMPYIWDDNFIGSVQFFADEFFGKDFETVFAEISQWQSHIYEDATISNGQSTYPVIIFTTMAGMSLERGLQGIDLASHGYIVIELIHSYSGTTDDKPPATFTLADLVALAIVDNSALIDILEIEAVNTDDWLISHMDLEHIGIVGFSIGGESAQTTAAQDDRITAGINQDFGGARVPAEQPFLHISIRLNPGQSYRNVDAPVYLLRIVGFAHDSLTDWIFWPELATHPQVLVQGMTPLRAHTIFTTYQLAFFDEYLKGIEQPLLDGPSDDFPEVIIESRNTD